MLRFDSTPTIIHNRTCTQKQTPVLLTLASAAPMIQDEATTNSACNNPVRTRPMSDITDHELKLVANHENTSHGVTFSEENNVHVLPQDDLPSTPAVKADGVVAELENENLHPVHSSPTLAVQDQDAAQECQSLSQFQSPIF